MKPRVAGEAAALHLVARVTTSALQRAAIAISLSTRAHLAHAAHRVHGHGLRLRRERQARQHHVVHELDAVVHRAAARPGSASCGRRRGWCRRRSASGRPRWRRAARASSSADFRFAASGEPLALERLAAAQAGQRCRVDDVEAGALEQPLGHRGQRSRRRRGRAAGPCCARRSWGSRRRARRAGRRCRPRHEVHRPRQRRRPLRQARRPRPCAGRRARPSSRRCRPRRAAGRRRPGPARTPAVSGAVVPGRDVGHLLAPAGWRGARAAP